MPHAANPPNTNDPPAPIDVKAGAASGKLRPFADEETRADLVEAVHDEIAALNGEIQDLNRRREQLIRWRETILEVPPA